MVIYRIEWKPTQKLITFSSYIANMTTPISETAKNMETTNNVVAPTEIINERKAILPSLTMTQTKLETHIEQELNNADNFPPNIPVKNAIGKLGLMWPNTYATKHKATPLLSS